MYNTAFAWQQWLRERASVLRYAYTFRRVVTLCTVTCLEKVIPRLGAVNVAMSLLKYNF